MGSHLNTTTHVDLIISADYIIPVIPKATVLKHCSLIIKGGRIEAICPNKEAQQNYTTTEHLELGNSLLMPGLINAHGHAAMTLLRGYSDDKPLMDWLQQDIWPAEKNWVDEVFCYTGCQLAIAEMIRSGTTCFSDMYFFPEACAEAAHQTGIRAQITFPVLDFPNNWSQNADEAIKKGLELRDNYRSHSRINVGFGPHAPYTVSDDVFKRIATISPELLAPVQVHLHETQYEVDESIKLHQMRPIQRLHQLGALSPLTQCVHMTALNDEDIELLKLTGASVIHCPESNLKLASGQCPTQKLIDNGINVAIGTDGAASNNDLDMFSELRTAALTGKLAAADPCAIDSYTAIEMATINGAKALGIEQLTGSLEPGKLADIIAIDLNHPATMPCHDAASLVAYSNLSHQVSHSWVEGKALMENGQLTTLDMANLQTKVKAWQQKLSGATV